MIRRLPVDGLVVLALLAGEVRRHVKRAVVRVGDHGRHTPGMRIRIGVRHDRADHGGGRVRADRRVRRHFQSVRRERLEKPDVVLRERGGVDADLVKEHGVGVRRGKERPLRLDAGDGVIDRRRRFGAFAFLLAVHPDFELVAAADDGHVVPPTVRKRGRTRRGHARQFGFEESVRRHRN